MAVSKPLSSPLEIVEIDIEGTYRAVYTLSFKEVIVVLHVFKKKSKEGIKTPKQEIDLIKSRLKAAESVYQAWSSNKGAAL